MDSDIRSQVSITWYKKNATTIEELECTDDPSQRELATGAIQCVIDTNNTLTLLNMKQRDISNYVCRVKLPTTISTNSNANILELQHRLTKDISSASTSIIYRTSQTELVLIIILVIFILLVIVTLLVIRYKQKTRFYIIHDNPPIYGPNNDENSSEPTEESNFIGEYKTKPQYEHTL